jgi:hypothetical protein
MSTQAVEKELVQLEKQYWQAMKEKNVEAALRMTDDPCIVTGAQGVASIGRDAFKGMMTDASWSLHDYDVSDVQVRMLSDDVAIVAYKVTEDLTVEGKPLGSLRYHLPAVAGSSRNGMTVAASAGSAKRL